MRIAETISGVSSACAVHVGYGRSGGDFIEVSEKYMREKELSSAVEFWSFKKLQFSSWHGLFARTTSSEFKAVVIFAVHIPRYSNVNIQYFFTIQLDIERSRYFYFSN